MPPSTCIMVCLSTHHDARLVTVRTTVNLADDVLAEVSQIRRETGLGLSDAVNELARRGMTARPSTARYVHRSVHLGLKLDVSNLAEVLELLDEPGPA